MKIKVCFIAFMAAIAICSVALIGTLSDEMRASQSGKLSERSAIREVKRYIEDHSNDPKSIEWVQIERLPGPWLFVGHYCNEIFHVRYRSNNVFGARQLTSVAVRLDGNKIAAIHAYPDFAYIQRNNTP